MFTVSLLELSLELVFDESFLRSLNELISEKSIFSIFFGVSLLLTGLACLYCNNNTTKKNSEI